MSFKWNYNRGEYPPQAQKRQSIGLSFFYINLKAKILMDNIT
jgi:hypothetical protein